MTWENGQTSYCVLALKVTSDQNLPWQQALKKDHIKTLSELWC